MINIVLAKAENVRSIFNPVHKAVPQNVKVRFEIISLIKKVLKQDLQKLVDIYKCSCIPKGLGKQCRPRSSCASKAV